ncbi:MAG: hypothetical protein R3F43_21800 [bacterium]
MPSGSPPPSTSPPWRPSSPGWWGSEPLPLDSALARVGREGRSCSSGPARRCCSLPTPSSPRPSPIARVLADLRARFRRTMALMYRLTFAPPEALAIARALHARHAGVEGTLREGSARLPAGMPTGPARWRRCSGSPRRSGTRACSSTTASSAPRRRHARGLPGRCPPLRPLSSASPRAMQPPSWSAFQDLDRMLRGETLAVTGLAPPARAGSADAAAARRRSSSGGPGVRRQAAAPACGRRSGLPYGLTERALFATSIAALRRIVPRLPPAVRFAPAYQLARARAGLGRPPGPISRVAPRVALWLTAGAGPLRAPPPPPG